MDVARDFAHCSAVAVDLVPMQSMYVQCQRQDEALLIFILDICHLILGSNSSLFFDRVTHVFLEAKSMILTSVWNIFMATSMLYTQG